MGVVNVTPDSFSDGGCWPDPESAIAHARDLVTAGADIIDVGGESTRPGADPVTPDAEAGRVLPVVEALSPLVRVSVDTMTPRVAEAAVDLGATIVNDVSGSMDLARIAADARCTWVCMHMQGTPRTMQQRPHYDDVVAEVRDFLVARAEAGIAAGVPEVWIDPGIGFGKTTDHNLSLLRHLDVLVDTGHPVVVGTSRKSSLGRLTAQADGSSRTSTAPGEHASVTLAAPVPERLEASIATAVWAWQHGAAVVRVHDVAATVTARELTGSEFVGSGGAI